MKKGIIALGFAAIVGLTSFAAIKTNEVKVEESACRYGQCHAIAKSTGYRCRHCVSNSGDYYCWQH